MKTDKAAKAEIKRNLEISKEQRARQKKEDKIIQKVQKKLNN